jgi:rhodanese-related sulfurtransferase
LVRDTADPSQPARLLTGDTLFIGDAGRPDLVGDLGHSAEEMAGMLYDSLRYKIMPLDDGVEIWPGHGAGSACGRSISSERSTTLGRQRLANPALQPMARERFIAAHVAGLPRPPAYFAHAASLNRSGPALLEELPEMRLADAAMLQTLRAKGAQILDTRSAAAHGAGHPEGAINIGLSGQLEPWAGTLLHPRAPVVLVAETEAAAQEAKLRLARVGIEQVPAYTLSVGTEKLPQLTPAELRGHLARGGWQVIDVRQPAEFAAGHVPHAVSAPLRELPGLLAQPAALGDLARDRPTAVICGSGYRSSAAAHFLRRAGFQRLHNVAGGTNAWLQAGFEAER